MGKDKKIKISVIGGSGFVGTHLCRKLLSKKINFEIIDKRPTSEFPNHYKYGDVRDIESLRSVISGDVVVNLAAAHRDDELDKTEYHRTNVGGAIAISKVCEEKDIKRIIFTSTVAVYGFANPGTDENGEIRPFNEYGKSKFEAEEQFRLWQTRNGNSLIVVRPTAIFGEGNRGNVYNLFKQIATKRFVMIGSGENKKSLAYIGNVVEFLEFCLSVKEKHIICNYVDEPNLKIRELVQLVYMKLGINKNPLKIPFLLALFLGYLMDLFHFFTGVYSPISAIRVRKFTANTEFSSSNSIRKKFSPPFSLSDGLNVTIEKEFM